MEQLRNKRRCCPKLVIGRLRNPIPTLLQGWKEHFALSYKDQRKTVAVCPLGATARFLVHLGAEEGGRAPLQRLYPDTLEIRRLNVNCNF